MYDDYMTTAETANFLHVTKQAVEKWRKKGLLTPDVIGHGKNGRSGVYYYSKEKIMQLASVYTNTNANQKENTNSENANRIPTNEHQLPTPTELVPTELQPDKKNYATNQSVEKNIMSANKSDEDFSTIADKKQSRIAKLVHFFNQLYGKIPESHFVYLWTKQSGIFSFAISDETQREAMAKKAIELANSSIDIWHAVNPVYVEPTSSKRGDENSVSYQTAIIVDIDIRSAAHKGDPSFFAADFDEAKSFLPFTPSIIIHSGYGLHAYYIFDTPIKITNENREEIKRRNNLLLEVIRQRANGKKIDGVGDLPRVLRTPGTFNYKLGKDNAPLCHIVEDSGLRFSPSQIDNKLKALIQPQSPKAQASGSVPKKFKKDSADDRDLNIFCVRRMLDFISPSSLTYDDWLAVGMALKNIGMDCSDWEQWSRADERFKDGECEFKWNGFNRDGYGIGTLCMFAQQGGYDAKETYREWYKLHPNLRPSAKRNMDEETKRELDDAFILLDTLEPETFTDGDAYAPDNLHAVALATAYGYPALAKKFFDTIKAAQSRAKIRITDSKSELTAKLTPAEKKELDAILNVGITEIRRYVEREVRAIEKAHATFLKDEKKKRLREKYEKEQAEREARVIETKSRLDELRAMPASPERDAEMIELIRDACDWHCNRQGFKESVKATAANIDKIFTYDPNLDGLIGYDEFQQADVFLKSPPWTQSENMLIFQNAPKIDYNAKALDKSNLYKGIEWTDRDDSQLQLYIRRTYTEFANEKLTFNAITAYSEAHRFHEVKEFFYSLPAWDGKPRAKKLFVKFLGADDTPYVHEVTLNVLTAAVARIFHPGCEYQLAPILLGDQGIGKSYLIAKLFGKWYGSLVDDVSDPHAIDAIQRLWGVEIKEMAAMKKDVDANKRFIDSAKDTRRQAYARRATTIPRHCVFLITTNNKMCLTDMTGNRRYPIIVCHNKPRQYVEGLTDE